MATIQIDLGQLLSFVSFTVAIAWSGILMLDQLKKMKLTVTVIIMALLGIITTMWLIGIETPEASDFMWHVVFLVVHFIALTIAMTALQRQCNKEN